MLYMALVYFMNATAPRLAGKFQVSLTVIKLVPILLMAVIGTVAGLRSGLIVENFTAAAAADAVESPLFAALAATSFAYEGWVIATTINAEIKNAKRNLPLPWCSAWAPSCSSICSTTWASPGRSPTP